MKIRSLVVALFAATTLGLGAAAPRSGADTLPPGNTVQQWDKIAEDTIVGSGAFQNEGLIYMAYVSNAMYNAVAPGERNGQSADAAVVEAAYTTLSHYFPAQAATLDALHQAALDAIPDDQTKVVGMRVGARAAAAADRRARRRRPRHADRLDVVVPDARAGAGRVAADAGAYAAPQTPWVAKVRPFILQSADQFLPPPPPSLSSASGSRRSTRSRRTARARTRTPPRHRSRCSGRRT